MVQIRYTTYEDRDYWNRVRYIPGKDEFESMVDEKRGYICERNGKAVALLNYVGFLHYAVIENYVNLVERFSVDEHIEFLDGCCKDMAKRGAMVAVLCYDKNNRYHNNVYGCGFVRHGYIPDLHFLIGPEEEIRVRLLVKIMRL